MEITINDKKVSLPNGATLHDALSQEGVTPQGIATAVNGAVVTSNERATHQLNDGDAVIIIKAFYGG